jgi:hypothetical protein
MNGILGKIVDISPIAGSETGKGEIALAVKLKPACLLPERCAVPDWLADQALSVRRTVRDVREAGGVGDSIVLTARESEPYLQPLIVEPAICYGSLPETIRLTLRWVKDDSQPEYEMIAGGGVRKGAFVKEGDCWEASVATADLFGYKPSAPATITAKVDKLEATCTLLDADSPAFSQIVLPVGPSYRLENSWYAIDVSLSAGAGAIEKFVEKGREIDHFAPPHDMIFLNHEGAGHLDRVRIGSGWDWFDKLRDTAVSSVGARSEGGATRLTLESALDDGQSIRTTVIHALFDDIPLLTMQRDYVKGKAAEGDKKDDRPKEPINDATTVGVGFRSSWARERGKAAGSRILYADQDRLAVVRSAMHNDFNYYPDWKISGGWCLMEHPGRQEHMLYLFGTKDAPNLATWAGPHTITLEPSWPMLPLTAGQSVGVTLGLAAGELGGASPTGAWIACRSTKNNATRIGVVARLSERQSPEEDTAAEITLGGETRTASLTPLFIAGIGTLHIAIIEFGPGGANTPFTARVAGIPGRLANARSRS